MPLVERHPGMDKQNQLLILLSGVMGLMLAVLTARSKKATDSIIAVIGGMFGALVIAPAFAEAMTKLSQTFQFLSWLDASPGTAVFCSVIGFGGLLGGQIVIALKSDFIAWVKGYGRKRLGIKDSDRLHDTDS